MSNKRPLSPEINYGQIIDNNNNNLPLLKRLKLHSIIEELRNEEANLVLLKKLRSCQQLITRTTNGFHSTATRISTSRSSIQQTLPSATRKTINSPNLPIQTKNVLPSTSTIHSLEERKAQAKKALRNQLERDLLNIPSPKPLIQDISFIPNPNSLEFQPYIGLEDVVQCLFELQTERQRLPQRFTDRAQISQPNICDHCGTDFTIRWWKHLTNILCDRCKKQATRRTLKSEHSTLLKNVFVTAMEHEKEIEKTFQALSKQQQKVSPHSSTIPTKSNSINRPVSSPIPSFNPKTKTKTSSVSQMQNFATKLSQQSTSTNAVRKSNMIIQSQVNNNRTFQQTKTPLPAHQQQQFRSSTSLSQQTKSSNQIVKIPKAATRQQFVVPPRPIISPLTSPIPPLTIPRPTATKRRTLPSTNTK